MAGSDERARAEFDLAYAEFVVASHRVAGNFFRYSPGQVEDVVAEALARTFERWERVRRHDNPVGWVVLCTKNVCLEELRRQARGSRRSFVGDDIDLTDFTEQSATAQTITDALGRLSKRQRDVAVLRYLMDLDEATTANVLGTSVSKVKTAAHEARGRLRGLLADEYLAEAAVDG
jgi:RNA polymerase sigma factor (sigma-70 family)